ncbi:uncharacterized protein PHACADRAFT_197994 [Phanerochaete carnosa HHB-10118-sp]|uniref:Uncharacterized protein n=1 Tax=Phanerochaete carnosa (strain HHB-10118-sp) TaxID=650164 RepID=K5W351_PHACS|nr:uncharacterized protein PHACADRAFT_197994 [Phanerochaete carnosa HHB-10118-sp]EKM53570.1 hypothetical protein PHACADRAFT_197994 [Phanerochaete carnosa HHB-10118-sp]
MPLEVRPLVQYSTQARLLRRPVFIQPSLEVSDPPSVVWGFPRLEKLEAPYSFRGSLHSICSPSLRRLILRPCSKFHGPREYYFATPAELVWALANTPSLELLDVELLDAELGGEPMREVSLSRLRTLRLSGDICSCANVFQHLAVPRDVQIQIFLPWTRGLRVHLLPINQSISAIASWAGQRTELDSKFKPIQSLRITVHTGGCMLQGWRTVRDLSRTPCGDNASEPHADVQLAIPRDASEEYVTSLLMSLPIHSLQVLEIGRMVFAYDTRGALAHLCVMPSLRGLVITSVLPEAVLQLIAATTAREFEFRGPEGEWPEGDPSEFLFGIPYEHSGTAEELTRVCAR